MKKNHTTILDILLDDLREEEAQLQGKKTAIDRRLAEIAKAKAKALLEQR